MLTLLRGGSSDLIAYCSQLSHELKYAVMAIPQSRCCGRIYKPANGSLRSLLAQVRLHIGDGEFTESVRKNKVAASFFLDRVYNHLSSAERMAYEHLQMNPISHLSHNWFIADPLISEWARLFYDLLSKRPFTLVAPILSATNGTLVALLRKLFIEFDLDAFNLIAGFENKGDRADHLEVDANGIHWRSASSRKIYQDLASFDDSKVEIVDDVMELEEDFIDCGWVDPLDSNRDFILFQELCGKGVSRESLASACEILERIFSGRDFTAALQFGSKLIEHREAMSAEQRARVHNIIALSAHNRQFERIEGSANFNNFLENHLEEALRWEEDPLRRSAVGYRLAVTLARRKRMPDEAIGQIDKCLEAVSGVLPSRGRAYQEAWLLNIRSFSSMLRGDKKQAARDVENAFRISEEHWNGSADVTRDEIFSAHVFAGNRSALALYEGDMDTLSSWFELGTSLFAEHWDTDKRYVRYLAMVLSRDQFDLQRAVAAGREGLEDAKRARSAEYQDLYAVNLAELHYRLGQLDLARKYAQAALDLYGKIDEQRRLLPVLMFLASVEFRSGNFMAVDHLHCQAEPLAAASVTARADILSRKVIWAAQRADVAVCEVLADSAIEAAVSCGERDTLLLVTRRVAEALYFLGQRREAVDVYRRAIEIAGAATPNDGHPPLVSEMFRIWLRLYEIEGNGDLLRQVISVLPRALREDGDCWWELPRLLALLDVESCCALRVDFPDEVAALFKVAAQRSDCRGWLELFGPQSFVRSSLGSSAVPPGQKAL